MYLRHPLTNPLFPAADPNPRVALRPRAPPPPRPFELEIIVRFQAYRYFFRGLAAGVASFIRWSRGSRVYQPSTTPAMAFWGERAGFFPLLVCRGCYLFVVWWVEWSVDAGVEVKPGKPYTHTYQADHGRLRICQVGFFFLQILPFIQLTCASSISYSYARSVNLSPLIL